jgi:pantoate--beta-alanine ligase
LEAEQSAKKALMDAGFEPEYVAIRRQSDLSSPAEGDRNLVILVAARFAGVRLIDNVELCLV